MVRHAPDNAHQSILTVVDVDPQVTPEDAVDYLRGYLDGHDQGNAAGAATAAIVRQFQARAWGEGYDAGRANGITEAREDVAQIITDLATAYAEIGEAFAQFGRITHEQRVAAEIAQMETYAIGQWPGLEHGGILPSADWKPDTTKLAAQAEKWLAIATQYEPAPCGICRPPADILCRCAGVITYRRTAIRHASSTTRSTTV